MTVNGQKVNNPQIRNLGNDYQIYGYLPGNNYVFIRPLNNGDLHIASYNRYSSIPNGIGRYSKNGDGQGSNIATEQEVRNILANNVRDTRLIDEDGELTKFARIGARLFGHDLYDGSFDGDVVFRTLTNPRGSGNSDFTRNRNDLEMVKKWGEMDLKDDGVVNGSVYAELIEDVWPKTDGVDIDGFLTNGANFTPASLDKNEWNRDLPQILEFNGRNPSINVDNFNRVARKLGITGEQLLDATFWGHRILDLDLDLGMMIQNSDRLIDQALSGRDIRTLDQILVRDIPGFDNHLASLRGDISIVGGSVLNLIRQLTQGNNIA